jgi:hypothetical protein
MKKKLYKRGWFWIVIVLLAGIGAYTVIGRGGGAPANNATAQTNTIVYSVTGSGTPTVSTITYANIGNGKGQTGQVAVSDVAIPWSKTITAKGPLTAFSLTVVNGSVGLSYVTCTISENGELLSTNTSKGPSATASCDAFGTG